MSKEEMKAELLAEVEAERTRKRIMTAGYEQTRREVETPEQAANRVSKQRAYEQRTRKYWTAHKHNQRHERRRMIVEYLGGKCVDCGGVFHPSAYDVHHIDPNEKSFTISEQAQHAWATILAELDKCELVCANCHRVRHAGEEKDMAAMLSQLEHTEDLT